MQYLIDITGTRLIALTKAAEAYNASNPELTIEQFVQKLMSGVADSLVQSYLTTVVTNLTFLMRFTQAERAAIRTAGETDPVIKDYVAMVTAADTINLTSELTTTGVQALETAGLIGAGRAAEILAL